MFVLYLRKVSLIKYIRRKNIQLECGEHNLKMLSEKSLVMYGTVITKIKSTMLILPSNCKI